MERFENAIVFKTALHVESGQTKDYSSELPLKASSSITRLARLHQCKASNISVEAVGSRLKYEVTGFSDWKLLNYVVYKQKKTYLDFIEKT